MKQNSTATAQTAIDKAYARSVETLESYARHIGFIRAKSQLASIAGNSLAARYVRDAAETVLKDILSALHTQPDSTPQH